MYKSSRRRVALVAQLVVVAISWCLAPVGRAQAQETHDVVAAARAYSRAQEAEIAGRWAEAASLYALADDMAPTSEALRSAARAALRAGLSAVAATHAALLLPRSGRMREGCGLVGRERCDAK